MNTLVNEAAIVRSQLLAPLVAQVQIMVVLTHHIVDLAAQTAHQVQGVTTKRPISEASGSVRTVTSTSAPTPL
jgi:hypothetical protein